MTAEHMKTVCNALAERCQTGNTWPPDFAEFLRLVAVCSSGSLNITAADVLTEYNSWRRNAWRYDGARNFPWRLPVLFHICTELRRACIDRNLSEAGRERHAAELLLRWEKKVAAGYSVPPIPADRAPAKPVQKGDGGEGLKNVRAMLHGLRHAPKSTGQD
ncbi:replication protein P [Pantoea sp. BAV 3049]|uniref:replication protein P n=1 Tax=Pantoea sp. BAV 3049 TaxID=2654188 RepID=UPI00131BF8BD|nr:replication protein P [Pantoea sp. BAV 3049]